MALKFPKSEKYNFTRNLVKRHKLVPYLDRYLGEEVKNFHFTYDPKEHDHAWHPSGHCTPSITELYGIATEDQGPHDWGVAMLKTFMVGHFWHQLLQKAVVDLGLAPLDSIERRGFRVWGTDPTTQGLFCPECFAPINPKFFDPEGAVVCMNDHTFWGSNGIAAAPYHWTTGAGDVAPCSIPKHGDYLVDFKTMSAHQFKPFEASGQLPDWAKDKYEAQINIYMDFFDLEKALIVGVCKDSPHTFAEAEFRRNQPLIDAIYDKWHFVSECLDTGYKPNVLDDEQFDLTPLFAGTVAQ